MRVVARHFWGSWSTLESAHLSGYPHPRGRGGELLQGAQVGSAQPQNEGIRRAHLAQRGGELPARSVRFQDAIHDRRTGPCAHALQCARRGSPTSPALKTCTIRRGRFRGVGKLARYQLPLSSSTPREKYTE